MKYRIIQCSASYYSTVQCLQCSRYYLCRVLPAQSSSIKPPLGPALHCTVLHCTALHSALYCAVQCNTVPFSAIQFIAVQWNTVQCSAVFCSAVHCIQCSKECIAPAGHKLDWPETAGHWQERILQHCTALNCTALHCTALHCTALHCCKHLPDWPRVNLWCSRRQGVMGNTEQTHYLLTHFWCCFLITLLSMLNLRKVCFLTICGCGKDLWLWLLPLVTGDRWQVTGDSWHITHDTRHITHDTWHMIFFFFLYAAI